MDNIVEPVKVKRGRRSKKDILKAEEDKKLLQLQLQENTVISETILLVEEIKIESLIDVGEECDIKIDSEVMEEEEDNAVIKPPAKKRGRKPKGGKIIQQNLQDYNQKVEKPNIILHLKCSMKDLHNSEIETNYNNPVDSFHFSTSKNELSYEVISKPEFMNESELLYNNNHHHNNTNEDLLCGETMFDNNALSTQSDTKEIWRKLKILEKSLHMNDISDKKSACFWCSYDFDNTPIYIPKYFIKNSYHVYGNFCTPECAVAHLMNENIDSSTKFERYHLINYIYSKIYEYKKNIKPAPDPYYMLERYYGNLTIQEYRALLKSERLFLIVDKPLTRILPELHEDNDEFIINNKIIPSSNNFQVKKKIQKKPQNKSSILSEKFGGSGVLSE
jgi:hypothetical protein